MDFEDIAPGQRFAQAIDDTLARTDIALIVIGPRWTEILHRRAQEQQPDYVCREIEAVLARQITVVPVLVGGASTAQFGGLPDNLSGLSQYEAAVLRDSNFSEDCARLTKALGLQATEPKGPTGDETGRRKTLPILVGAAMLIALLIAASGWMGIGPVSEYRARKATINEMFATGRTQAERAEYESAFQTYRNLVKIDPGNPAAMDLELNAAMRWLQNFHVLGQDGKKPEDLAAALLAEITPVLDAGLARTKRPPSRVADILAHIGWAHWLNQRMAYREFGDTAERDLRQALITDPSNVFAHAMLGNLLKQKGGRTGEALQHFRLAAEQNRERPLVRQLQLGAMIYPRDAETRVALIQVANEMRRNGEPIDTRQKSRILTAYNPTVNTAGELKETLSAVPPADARATYLWLDEPKTSASEVDYQRVCRAFVEAGILEIEGKRQEALAAFENLRGELKRRGYDGRIATHVETAARRLSTP